MELNDEIRIDSRSLPGETWEITTVFTYLDGHSVTHTETRTDVDEKQSRWNALWLARKTANWETPLTLEITECIRIN